MMKLSRVILGFSALMALTSVGMGRHFAAETGKRQPEQPDALSSAAPDQGVLFHPESVDSEGSVTVEGSRIDYRATAGTIIVHPKDWDDAAWREHPGKAGDDEDKDKQSDKDKKSDQDLGDRNPTRRKPRCSMSPISRKARRRKTGRSPSCSMAGPARPPCGCTWAPSAAPGSDAGRHPHARRALQAGRQCLQPAGRLSDLVFIDAPGTGFSRIAGKDKEKAFYGVDPDAYAFSQFVLGFLSKYGRWNSPKYPVRRKLRHAAQRQSWSTSWKPATASISTA